ncbi:MAG TPA: hypothetical protein VL485_11040 [Ktedonobacteraceae bacterium]|jgi:hypothetical protein|nr:hypothetical protein [Ktedonobacteraceae bacterium]
MNSADIQQRFPQIWLTLAELSIIFGQTSREMTFYLEKLGLRTFDTEHHQYMPTMRAHEQGLCLLTSSRRRNLFYLWHKQKVSALLQEQMHLQLLTEEDRHARSLALQLLYYCKKQRRVDTTTFDPLRDIFFAPDMPTIMAWYIVEEGKRTEIVEPNSRDLLMLVNDNHAHMISQELERLGSDVWLADPLETETICT